MFDATLNGVNELDLKIQEIRQEELLVLVNEASTLREQATDINEAMDTIDGYLRRLRDLCDEVSRCHTFFLIFYFMIIYLFLFIFYSFIYNY